MSVFDDIRRGCQAVAERAVQVTLDHERIADYAASLALAEKAAPALDPERHYLGHGTATVAFIITLDAINFGSGYFPHLKKRPGHSGYFTVAAALNDAFRAHGFFEPGQLADLDRAACARIFGQEPLNEASAELMGLFARALNDLGRLLIAHYGGQFTGLVEAAEGSAARLVELLRQMPFFDDRQRYQGTWVPFYKRAQLTAADLALAVPDTPWGRFRDLDQLTIFADNLVPHVLRLDGILVYTPELAARIDREELIAAHSPEEIEIRASALHAVELIAQALRASGRQATAMDLDYLLWNRGQQPAYKQAKPRHRTQTVFY